MGPVSAAGSVVEVSKALGNVGGWSGRSANISLGSSRTAVTARYDQRVIARRGSAGGNVGSAPTKAIRSAEGIVDPVRAAGR